MARAYYLLSVRQLLERGYHHLRPYPSRTAHSAQEAGGAQPQSLIMQCLFPSALQTELDQLSYAGIHKMGGGTAGGAGAALNAGLDLVPCQAQDLVLEILVFCRGHCSANYCAHLLRPRILRHCFLPLRPSFLKPFYDLLACLIRRLILHDLTDLGLGQQRHQRL